MPWLLAEPEVGVRAVAKLVVGADAAEGTAEAREAGRPDLAAAEETGPLSVETMRGA